MIAALVRPRGRNANSSQRSIADHGRGLQSHGGGGGRDVVGKELDVSRVLNDIATSNGMRTRHVLDDLGRYGLPMDIVKTEGGTFTSWMLLEDDSGMD
ncbi:hypothetical protein ACHAXA_006915 [Cyclostephanos tholiformis]|uniref:Uncharacterized protein n=1 Tax=Cyclostephanos tholiformis TaxID=382380 RepID=A0ABD3RUY7_9STRA